MYEIEIAADAVGELRQLRSFQRGAVRDAIDGQLTHEPGVVTKNRKILVGLVPPFEATPPVWELRVGEIRVYYDIDEAQKKVYVRAIRTKPPHKTTEETL